MSLLTSTDAVNHLAPHGVRVPRTKENYAAVQAELDAFVGTLEASKLKDEDYQYENLDKFVTELAPRISRDADGISISIAAKSSPPPRRRDENPSA